MSAAQRNRKLERVARPAGYRQPADIADFDVVRRLCLIADAAWALLAGRNIYQLDGRFQEIDGRLATLMYSLKLGIDIGLVRRRPQRKRG